MTGFEQSLNGMSWADMATMVSQCQRCRLAPTRTRTVFGSGSTNPLIAFVGEGPGAEEDRQGEPFVGAAGHLLTRMLFALGLSREDVYIVNVVKCRPPGNRNPLPDEIAACEGYLFQQLTLLEPRIIVALGRFAILSLLGETGSVAAMRNRKDYTWRNIPVLPTYHPAFYLRQPSRKRDAWEDLLRLQAQLARMGYPIGHGQPSGHFLPALSPLLSPAAGTVGSAEPIAVAPGGC
jgi:uracil-DNA glycosylase family 4